MPGQESEKFSFAPLHQNFHFYPFLIVLLHTAVLIVLGTI